MGAHGLLLAAGDESIRDSLRRPLFAFTRVKCKSAWTLPEPWTPRTRPPLLGKPHRTRFPTAPTRIVVNTLHTRNSGQSPANTRDRDSAALPCRTLKHAAYRTPEP